MDVKKIGRIPDGGGWRAHGRADGQHREPASTRVGFDYVHSLVDDHSRLAYSEILPDEKGTTCAAFLARAIDYFAAHGITRIERLMTDNAWAYRCSLRDALRRARHPADVHQAALPLAERQGRAPQPHPADRVGLPPGLHHQRPSAPPPLRPGSSTTTLNAATAHSAASHRSADCHQPDGRVHLAGSLSPIREPPAERGEPSWPSRAPASSPACSPPASGPRSTAARTPASSRCGGAVELAVAEGLPPRPQRPAGCSASACPAPGGTAPRWRSWTRWWPRPGPVPTTRPPRPGCSGPWRPRPSRASTASSAGTAVAQGYDERGPGGAPTGPARPASTRCSGLAADAVGLGDAGAAAERLAGGRRPGRGPAGLVAPAGPPGLGAGRGRPARGAGRGRRRGRARRGRARRALGGAAPRRQGPAVPGGRPGRGRPARTRRPRRCAGPALLAESLGTLPLQWPVRAMLARPARRGRARRERAAPWRRPGAPSARSPTTCPTTCGRTGWAGPTWRRVLGD